jgi:hypothetical protein
VAGVVCESAGRLGWAYRRRLVPNLIGMAVIHDHHGDGGRTSGINGVAQHDTKAVRSAVTGGTWEANSSCDTVGEHERPGVDAVSVATMASSSTIARPRLP